MLVLLLHRHEDDGERRVGQGDEGESRSEDVAVTLHRMHPYRSHARSLLKGR